MKALDAILDWLLCRRTYRIDGVVIHAGRGNDATVIINRRRYYIGDGKIVEVIP
jgi:hypothetical protein